MNLKIKSLKSAPFLSLHQAGNYLYTKDAAANVNDDNPSTEIVKLFFLNYYTF